MKVIRFGAKNDGGLGEKLIQAVLRGEKTATCTLACEYGLWDEPANVGERLMILDGHGRTRGVIEVTAKTILPFGQADVGVAKAENFESVEAFRQAHMLFWSMCPPELAEPGWRLTETTPIVVEHFRLVEGRVVDEPQQLAS